MKTAIVTGITGQDGTYLTRLLLEKGYQVHGLHHRAKADGSSNILSKFQDIPTAQWALRLHHCGLESIAALTELFSKVQPDEVYNLASQSNYGQSFIDPEHTSEVNGMGVMRVLEAIRNCNLERKTRLFQAASSELYGHAKESPQTESTPFYPRSPYAVAKLYAYWFVVSYRELYGIHASNGILFNHESPLRSERFVTRKITRSAAAICLGKQDVLELGNIEARRDWTHAGDFVEGMWRMLQADHGDDYILATGCTHTVREFVELAFEAVDISLNWTGSGLLERGICTKSGRVRVAINPDFYRPTDVGVLVGNPSKARSRLDWQPKIPLKALVSEMVAADLKEISHGH